MKKSVDEFFYIFFYLKDKCSKTTIIIMQTKLKKMSNFTFTIYFQKTLRNLSKIFCPLSIVLMNLFSRLLSSFFSRFWRFFQEEMPCQVLATYSIVEP